MMWVNTIKRYYDNGHPSYTDESLKTIVKAGMITADQYYQITKIEYVA